MVEVHSCTDLFYEVFGYRVDECEIPFATSGTFEIWTAGIRRTSTVRVVGDEPVSKKTITTSGSYTAFRKRRLGSFL
jgi:hypothetical protein